MFYQRRSNCYVVFLQGTKEVRERENEREHHESISDKSGGLGSLKMGRVNYEFCKNSVLVWKLVEPGAFSPLQEFCQLL